MSKMKLEECEKIAEDFIQGKRNVKDVKITSVRRKGPLNVEVKGYCEGTKFMVELDTDLAEITAYDFNEDIGEFGFSQTPIKE
ncbi:hypothetical protein E2P71_06485 [Candidatus Bathyarchaeota archaeon]|nr:hypothetical protein E2P71_06485 [Candidatus Bathyarchaeota archaeon]